MAQVNGGIKALSRAILDDTKGEAEAIVAEAQAAAKRVVEQARAESQAIRADILSRAESEIAHMEQQAMATGRLEAQRIMLNRREELIDRVFNLAEDRLASLYQEPDYPEILRRLISDAIRRLGEPPECVVRVAAHDSALLTEAFMAALAKEHQDRVRLAVGEPVDILGGAIVETSDGRKRFDNSLESRLRLERARLRADVYRLLQGES